MKVRGTGLEPRPDRTFVIVVAHIQCSKLLEGLECAVCDPYHNKPLKSFKKSRAQSRIRVSFCRDIAMNVREAT